MVDQPNNRVPVLLTIPIEPVIPIIRINQEELFFPGSTGSNQQTAFASSASQVETEKIFINCQVNKAPHCLICLGVREVVLQH